MCHLLLYCDPLESLTLHLSNVMDSTEETGNHWAPSIGSYYNNPKMGMSRSKAPQVLW